MVKLDKNAIQSSREFKDVKKKEIYRKLYSKVCEEINKQAKNHKTSCIYDIPLISSEFPCFDVIEAAKYVTKKLEKHEIKVIQNSNTLVINWK